MGRSSLIHTERKPQIDGLRAFAVAAVVYSHWLPQKFQFNIPFGFLGVTLFFVISGYLITNIIFNHKSNNGKFLRSFYIRRALRIIPPYYLTLVMLYVFSIIDKNSQFIYHFLYLTNFYLFFQGEWKEYIAHFWSLSVEEQFYLIWPWVVLASPRKLYFKIIVFTLILSIVLRILIVLQDSDLKMTSVLPFIAFDGIAGGALLSYMEKYTKNKEHFVKICKLIGAPIFIASLIIIVIGYKNIYTTNILIISAIVTFIYVVNKAVCKFGGVAGLILSNRFVVYIGTISYGIYIYHVFMDLLLKNFLNYANLSLDWKYGVIGIIIKIILLISISAVSWHFFEKPINNLKVHFPYKESIK